MDYGQTHLDALLRLIHDPLAYVHVRWKANGCRCLSSWSGQPWYPAMSDGYVDILVIDRCHLVGPVMASNECLTMNERLVHREANVTPWSVAYGLVKQNWCTTKIDVLTAIVMSGWWPRRKPTPVHVCQWGTALYTCDWGDSQIICNS